MSGETHRASVDASSVRWVVSITFWLNFEEQHITLIKKKKEFTKTDTERAKICRDFSDYSIWIEKNVCEKNLSLLSFFLGRKNITVLKVHICEGVTRKIRYKNMNII